MVLSLMMLSLLAQIHTQASVVITGAIIYAGGKDAPIRYDEDGKAQVPSSWQNVKHRLKTSSPLWYMGGVFVGIPTFLAMTHFYGNVFGIMLSEDEHYKSFEQYVSENFSFIESKESVEKLANLLNKSFNQEIKKLESNGQETSEIEVQLSVNVIEDFAQESGLESDETRILIDELN